MTTRGIAPLQITWRRDLVDTGFRAGRRHKAADETMVEAVRRLLAWICDQP